MRLRSTHARFVGKESESAIVFGQPARNVLGKILHPLSVQASLISTYHVQSR
jgi:hypothetical protein